jgi:hypothetical protein
MISDSMQDPSPLNFSDKDRLDKVKNGLTTETNALRTGPSPIATERSIYSDSTATIEGGTITRPPPT